MSIKILAIDTATENCSVALLNGDTLISRCEYSPRGHATHILPMVDAVLSEAQLRLTDLNALAFGRGPGSFTGVRIGIGIAQGLAFGANLPMIGISTLMAMAQACYRQHGAEHVACAIDARMSEIYWGRFERQINGEWKIIDNEAVIAPQILTEQIKQDNSRHWHCAGTGWQAYQEVLTELPLKMANSKVLYPEACDMAILAKIAYAQGRTVSAEQAEPIYLRDNVAAKKQ